MEFVPSRTPLGMERILHAVASAYEAYLHAPHWQGFASVLNPLLPPTAETIQAVFDILLDCDSNSSNGGSVWTMEFCDRLNPLVSSSRLLQQAFLSNS